MKIDVWMDVSFTHQLAFDHGKAQFAEDLTQENQSGLLQSSALVRSV